MMLLNLILFTIVVLVNSFTWTQHDNELMQYERYLHWINTSNHDIFFNEQGLFQLWSSRGYFTKELKRSQDVNKHVRGTYPHMWDWKMNGVRLEVDCVYEARLTGFALPSHLNKRLSFEFSISQSRCNTSVSMQGGSSFEVITSISTFDLNHVLFTEPGRHHQLSTHSVHRCEVRDEFNGQYLVSCSTAMSAHDRDRVHCLNMSMYLDFEHFDAFSEVNADVPRLRHVVPFEHESILHSHFNQPYQVIHSAVDARNNVVVCIGPREPASSPPSTSHQRQDHFNHKHSEQWSMWFHEVSSSECAPLVQKASVIQTMGTGSYHPSKVPAGYNSSVRCSSRGEAWQQWHNSRSNAVSLDGLQNLSLPRVFPSLQFASPLASFISPDIWSSSVRDTDLVFIGESHMRYNWDLTAIMYYSRQFNMKNIPRKHDDIGVSGFTYVTSLFVSDLAKLVVKAANSTLLRDDGSSYKQRLIFIQAGSWDLFFPVRNFISNPLVGLMTLVKAIELIIDSRAEGSTETKMKPLHVVWLDCFIRPRLADEKYIGWRNLFSTSASNQFFKREIVRMLRTKTGVTKIRLPGLVYSEDDDAGSTSDDNYSFHTSFYIPASSLTLTLVHSLAAVSPRMELVERVCGDHLLCCEGGTLTSSPGGLLIATTLTHFAVNQGHDESEYNRTERGMISRRRYLRATSERRLHDSPSLHSTDYLLDRDLIVVTKGPDVTLSTEQSLQEKEEEVQPTMYLMFNGMKRAVPDMATLTALAAHRVDECSRFTHVLVDPSSSASGECFPVSNRLIRGLCEDQQVRIVHVREEFGVRESVGVPILRDGMMYQSWDYVFVSWHGLARPYPLSCVTSQGVIKLSMDRYYMLPLGPDCLDQPTSIYPDYNSSMELIIAC